MGSMRRFMSSDSASYAMRGVAEQRVAPLARHLDTVEQRRGDRIGSPRAVGVPAHGRGVRMKAIGIAVGVRVRSDIDVGDVAAQLARHRVFARHAPDPRKGDERIRGQDLLAEAQHLVFVEGVVHQAFLVRGKRPSNIEADDFRAHDRIQRPDDDCRPEGDCEEWLPSFRTCGFVHGVFLAVGMRRCSHSLAPRVKQH